MSFAATIITLFPEMFPGPLGHSLIGKALSEGIWSLDTVNIRDFGLGRHQLVDDTPYGGGAGMVMRPDVIDAAIQAGFTRSPDARLVHFTPRGTPFRQPIASALIETPLLMLCGRYEAIDERVIEKYQPLELSLGDFVMTGGELAAMAVLDACVRLLPGVIGESESLAQESFGLAQDYACLLEHPHYTKPPVWEDRAIPDVLLSGHHGKIDAWRKAQSEAETKARRPDLWQAYAKDKEGTKT